MHMFLLSFCIFYDCKPTQIPFLNLLPKVTVNVKLDLLPNCENYIEISAPEIIYHLICMCIYVEKMSGWAGFSDAELRKLKREKDTISEKSTKGFLS